MQCYIKFVVKFNAIGKKFYIYFFHSPKKLLFFKDRLNNVFNIYNNVFKEVSQI